MKLEELIKKLKIIFKENGELTINLGDLITELVRKHNVPNKYGFYLVSAYKKEDDSCELFYIGKSGTLLQDGSLKDQALRGRLTNQQKGMCRNKYFQKVITDNNFSKLVINWFVTFDDKIRFPPGYVEAKLLKIYYDNFQSLPKDNSTL